MHTLLALGWIVVIGIPAVSLAVGFVVGFLGAAAADLVGWWQAR